MTIEDEWGGGNETFFAFECGVEAFFDKAFANVGDGIGMAMKLPGNFGIANTSVLRLIDGK